MFYITAKCVFGTLVDLEFLSEMTIIIYPPKFYSLQNRALTSPSNLHAEQGVVISSRLPPSLSHRQALHKLTIFIPPPPTLFSPLVSPHPMPTTSYSTHSLLFTNICQSYTPSLNAFIESNCVGSQHKISHLNSNYFGKVSDHSILVFILHHLSKDY